MDYERAKEILNTENTIEVFYNDQSIWINNLDPQTNTAQVTTGTDEENVEVPIDALVEGNRLD